MRTVLYLSVIIGTANVNNALNLNLVSYNIQSFPDFLQKTLYLPNSNRIEHIPNALLHNMKQTLGGVQPDIIAFQEAFSEDSIAIISEFAHSQGYSILAPSKGVFWLQLNSGIILLSKTSFRNVIRQDYGWENCCGFDCFANKGFIYAETDINHNEGAIRIGIVSTHLQASDPLCMTWSEGAAAVSERHRLRQLRMIGDFLREKIFQNGEVHSVFLLGDLNIDASDDDGIVDFARIQDYLDAVPVNAPMQNNTRCTVDARDNSYLKRLSSPSTIQTPEHLDYIMAIPVPKRSQPSMRNIVMNIERSGYGDLSDHHAVVGIATIAA